MRAWAVLAGVMLVGAGATAPPVRLVRWSDFPPAIQERLRAGGLSESALPAFLDRLRTETDRRLRDGNFDHVVYYALQSTRLSPLPPIEPALSAKTFVEQLHRASIPADAAARLDALAAALSAGGHGAPHRGRDATREDARLKLFREIVADGGLDAPEDGPAARLARGHGGDTPEAVVADRSGSTAPRRRAGGRAGEPGAAGSGAAASGAAGAGAAGPGAAGAGAAQQSGAGAPSTIPRRMGSAQDALAERLRAEYVRAMGFLYEKEFVAARAADERAATAALYQTRAHSTDTQIEAGYAVSVALATLKALDPASRITRVLIIGPGLDLAPRTGLLESAPPQSYQPFAVADALIALGLSARADLRIDLADINPLVIHHFATVAATRQPVRLDVVSGLPDDERTRLSEDYRAYVRQWGRAIAVPAASAASAASGVLTPPAAVAEAGAAVGRTAEAGTARTSVSPRDDSPRDDRSASAPGSSHLAQTVLVDPAIARAMTAARFNIIGDRFTDGRQYDLIVITNVLPYFTDAELLMALANIASLLAPGGALVHNEPRPALLSAAAAIGLPAVQARTVLLASPAGGQPLHDTILLNRKD